MAPPTFEISGLRIASLSHGVFGSLVVLCIVYIIHCLRSFRKDIEVFQSPQYGTPGDGDFHNALTEGYKKHKDTTFTIPTAHHAMVMVPPRYLDQIKALPESILSFQNQVSARFLGKYTGLGVNDTLVHSVKVDLTKNIISILQELQDEVDYAVSKHIGDCPEWKEIPLYNMLLHLVALLSGRIFVGLPLSRNETWLEATLRYTIDGFVGAEKLWAYPKALHPVMQYLIPEVRNVRRYLKNGAALLGPVMEERQKAMRRDPTSQKPSDMVQWIVDNSEGDDGSDTDYVTKTQMLISVVAIHTTTMTTAQAIFDLVSHPEYIQPLREEVLQIQAEGGNEWTKASIAKRRKMDSFMKESQRFRPPGLGKSRLVVIRKQADPDPSHHESSSRAGDYLVGWSDSSQRHAYRRCSWSKCTRSRILRRPRSV
jgi:hypothetical protein